jgi:nickel transport protein
MKELPKLFAATLLSLTTWTWLDASTTEAHEFIIKPASLRVNAGDKVPFSVLSTHVFMSGEELMSAKTVKASLLEGNESADLPLKEKNVGWNSNHPH